MGLYVCIVLQSITSHIMTENLSINVLVTRPIPCAVMSCLEDKVAMASVGRVVVSVSTFRSQDVPTSRLGSRLEKNCQRLGLVLISAIYASCPRPIFHQIVQATVRSANGL